MQKPLSDLIVVAGHAPFKKTTPAVPSDPALDDHWVLQPFQCGEPPLYLAHIRHGVELWQANPQALLIFSGGYTRSEAGHRWSEADTYLAIAKHFAWWKQPEEGHGPALDARLATEDYSRDSFENLLFSLCRFQQVTGGYPREVTLVSWAFKRDRFELHREAIRLPAERFHFVGFNDPRDFSAALRGEAVTLDQFKTSRYGSAGLLAEKRAARNPLNRQHGFRECPGLERFFEFIEDPRHQQKDYPDALPWSW